LRPRPPPRPAHTPPRFPMPSGRCCNHWCSAPPRRRVAGHLSTRCGSSSTLSVTWCARAAPAAAAPRLPAAGHGVLVVCQVGRRRHPGAHPSGPARAGPGAGWPPADPDRGDRRLPIGAGGRHRAPRQPRLGCRQEGQRSQTPPGRGHHGAAAGGHGDRCQRPGPRRRPAPAVAAAGEPSRHAAGVGRCRVCRQPGRLGRGRVAPRGGDRAEAPWPVDLRGAAP
jgi:hypothetical protein